MDKVSFLKKNIDERNIAADMDEEELVVYWQEMHGRLCPGL